LHSRREFEAAYREHSPAIYRYLYWHTRDQGVASDLVADVFERAWRSRNSWTYGSARPWLFRIAHNRLVDYWRKRKEVSLEDVSGIPGDPAIPLVGDQIDHELVVDQLGYALDLLPEDMKSVIVLRFIEELSVREVAEVLGMTEANVRVVQFRALRKLRQLMGTRDE
jgi:RNA polymerase sigma-70 factor, ECF subfamily